jgi:DNA-binding transcriptional LysR family regulator
MFDWNDLKHFLAVARAGSTLAAAKVLEVNQSTVHRRLQELERRLGHQLVTRHPTGYRLTELGQEMRGYAERVEETIADFQRRLAASGKELGGIVKVTCPEALGPRLIGSGLIEKFNARYPALHVEFVMSDKIVNLAKGDADVAIRARIPADGALVGRKIANCPWAVYASRRYLAGRPRIERNEDIDRHSVVLFSGELRDHESVRWVRSVAPNAGVAARANSLPALLLAVKSGAGLAPMPVIVGENDKDLVRVLGPMSDIATPFYLLMHQDMRRTPRVRAFFDFMIEHLSVVRPLLGEPTCGKASKALQRRTIRR